MTRPSVPLVEMREGVPHWLVPGTDRYERDEKLEAIYMAAGVPKQMPSIAASKQMGAIERRVQSLRYRESYDVNDKLKSPFPWPGGKSDMAPAIWARLGDCPNFVEPFAGSAAVTLARPHDLAGKTETLNDLDGHIINVFRAITFAPEETAAWCDFPVSEADLTARHLHLKAAREELTARLFADPFYFDPILAAFWCWGIASWIGDGWCVSDGPWISVDGRLVDRRVVGEDAEGVRRKMPMITPGQNNVQNYRSEGVPRKMPEIGKSPNGQIAFNRKGVQAVRYGVPKQMPEVGAANVTRDKHIGGQEIRSGIQKFDANSALSAYFARLSDRLRRVRFLCGDWQRACKDSVTVNHGLTAVFLDPPYPPAEHDMRYHGENDAWHAAATWAIERGDDKRLRIAICGYHTEAIDQLFPPTWERLRWEARGGYANQKADGRGRANAKREIIYFSPHCIDATTDYGPLFAAQEAL